MNSTPLLLQGCMAVVSLSLILVYTFRKHPTGRSRKVCHPKLRDGSVLSAEVMQRDGGYEHYWGVLNAGGVYSGGEATADGRRCGEESWPYREKR